MDMMVRADDDGNSWQMINLLGRSMGRIVESNGAFKIAVAGQAIETMSTMKVGAFASLDDALLAIETHTRGTCRLASAENGPPGTL